MADHARIVLIGFAVAAAVLAGAYQFEITGLGLVGCVTTRFILIVLILRSIETPVVRWLTDGRETAAPEPTT